MSAAFHLGPAGRVSPLVKTARWTLLIDGIWWGSKRYTQLKKFEDERRAYEAKMKPICDAQKATAKGQLISECLFHVLNFPKVQGKKLTNICPRM